MRGITSWNYRPYTRLSETRISQLPYICRVAPGEYSITLQWFDYGSNDIHKLKYKKYKSTEPEKEMFVNSGTVEISGLESNSDYEIYIERALDNSAVSNTRLARTGYVPGIVVNYLHPEDNQYAFSGKSLCSPSIVKLPSGKLLASMDVFAGDYPQNLSLIFKSQDNGRTWDYVTDLFPCFWGKMFVHKGVLYMLSTSTEYGDLLIGASMDEGFTWTPPVRILNGCCSNADQGPHKAPMPIIYYNGRLYTALDYGSWKIGGHSSGMLSIDAEEDLLKAENWSCTSFLSYNSNWEGAAKGNSGGCLEGNAVVAPDGTLCNFLRYQISSCTPSHGKAVILKADLQNPEKQLEFNKIVEFDGGSNSKYDVLQDPLSKQYIAIVSKIVDVKTPSQRNVLAFASSPDLIHWNTEKILLDYSHMPCIEVGFQYVSFLIDGDDILYLSRTAMNNARNFHDANYQTFHVIKNFRQYLE